MALQSKTGANAIAYTPFNKTSWGFASGDLSGTHSGLANVKVVITPQSSTQWDATGHISTTGSGSAVASYNKQQLEWSCSGPLADVDDVLVALDLFPADFPAIRNWSNQPIKPNQTTGNFPIYNNINEEPEQDDPIPDTVFDLKVYDLSDGSLDGTYVITFDPTQPTFGKQRPYWSTEPSNEDASSADFSLSTGGLLDLGEISQLNPTTNVSDDDPLTLTCEFRNYGTSTPYPGSAYGQFTPSDNIFTGDKKPGATDNYKARINFTGTKAEVQSYLDNVRYYNMGNEDTFDMVFEISNGVVGSQVFKSIWFSDATIGATTVSSLSYIEDTAATWSLGAITTSNIQPDVDSFTATVTLDSTGISGADTLTTSTSVDSQSFNGTVLTITDSNEATLLTALQNLTFTPNDDFNSNFNMTFQLNYTGISTIGSSYTSDAQTVAVSGTAEEDINNHTTSHTYVEDNTYHFSAGVIPQIIHYANHNFTVTFTMGITAGRLGVSGSASTFTNVGNGVFTLAGTRNNVNADLLTLYYAPAADYNETHTITFTSDRTSGTGHASSSSIHTGSFTMTGTAVGEYSISQLVDVVWEEDVTKTFNSGLQITDTADETEDSPAFESHYIVACEMYNSSANGGGAYTDGTLRVASASQGSLTISATNGQGGNGLFGGNALTISGTKTEVNTAMQNLEFVPDPNFDGAGPEVWYYIKRVSDNAFLTLIGPSGYSYPSEVVTKFLDASATADYSITINTYDWEENVTKVFDSGLQITDKVTENPAYTTSPTAFYGTTYTVDVTMYVGASGTEYSNATLDTATKGSLTITGTGQSEADKFQMTGSRAEINAALKTMKFIPDIDNVETTNQTTLWYRIKRDYDYDWTTDAQSGSGEDGLLHNQGKDATGTFLNDVHTIFNTNSATTNYVITVPDTISWNEDQSKSFNSGVVITDKATENSDHASYFNTTFEIEARAKHYKVLTAGSFDIYTPHTIVTVGTTDFTAIGASANTVGVTFTPTGVGSGTGTASASQPMNEAVWNCTDNGGATVTGLGTDASRLTVTGTKAQVNTAMANMKMIPNLDMTTPTDHTSGVTTFWFEYKITRKHDSLVYLNYASGSTIFNLGTAIDPYHATVSGMAYNEDSLTTIFAGKDVGITETATADPLHSGNAVTYQVEVEISPNADGTWGSTGNSTYVTAVGNAEDVNAELQALEFTPTLDSAEDPSILYKQTRYRSGDSDLVQADGTVDIGTVTGTPALGYHTGITGMGYVEDTVTSIFDNVTAGVAETASEFTSGITYSVTLKIDPDTAGKWYGTTSATHTITSDTVDNVNAEIKQLRVHPTEEANDDFDILYSQTRHIGGVGVNDTVHATDVNIGTVTGTAASEYAYGTANGNIQYYVPDEFLQGYDTAAANSTWNTYINRPSYWEGELPTLEEHNNLRDQLRAAWMEEWLKFFDESPVHQLATTLTPKQLTLNQNRIYQRPINITDVSPGSQYKIIFSGGTLLTTVGASLSVMDTGWQTIADLNLMLDNGLYVTGVNDTNDNHPSHGATHTANFTIHRKTSVGVETQISNGQLTYSFLSGAKVYHYDTSADTETRIDNKTAGETVTLDVNYAVSARTNGSLYDDPDAFAQSYIDGADYYNILQTSDQLRIKASDGSSLPSVDTFTYQNIYLRFDNDAASGTTWDDYIQYWPTFSPNTYSNNFKILGISEDHTFYGLNRWLPVVRTTGITASENIGLHFWTPWGVKLKSGNETNPGDYTLTLNGTGI